MTAAAVPLSRMQRWMQEVVVHPGTVEEAVGARRARKALAGASIEDVILPSSRLSPAERVGVYQGMYLLRMEEALESDYPGLAHMLGHEGFSSLVRDYVQEHPSMSYTLNRLSDRLPAFVSRWRGTRRPAVAGDLARLEQAIAEVFDAEEVEALSEDEIAALPAEAWERLRLAPIPAFRLLALRYPVGAYLDSLSGDEHRHPALTRKDTFIAVFRRDYIVRRLELSRRAHDLLKDLVAGKRVGRAVAADLKRGGRRGAAADELFAWFRQWAAAGVFRSLSV